MNTLTVESSSIIGSKADLELLEEKKSGRILVLSDSHGDAELVRKIIVNFGIDCDALVFCGDGMWDIISFVREALYDSDLQAVLPPVVACARGNGDGDRYEMDMTQDEETSQCYYHYFEVQPMVSFRIAGRTVVAVHGHRHGVDYGIDTLQSSGEMLDADLVFFGHTHRLFQEESGASLVLNLGSCSRPRGGFPPTFAVVSFPGGTERYRVEYFEIKRTLFGGTDFVPYH